MPQVHVRLDDGTIRQGLWCYRYQALVPAWDAVNHVTGRCNTRLRHCAKTGALQMIATAPIRQGEQVGAAGHITRRTTLLLAQGRPCTLVFQESHVYQFCRLLRESEVQEEIAQKTLSCHIRGAWIARMTVHRDMLASHDDGLLADMQVINNFGPLSNAELLRRYGFVETANNPHDCLEVSVDSVLEVGLLISFSCLLQHLLQAPATSL